MKNGRLYKLKAEDWEIKRSLRIRMDGWKLIAEEEQVSKLDETEES